jgi:CRP-like cAMP-binding protein
VLILHLIFFPVNLYRLIQFQRLVRELHTVHPSDLSIESWLPHMRLRRMMAGETLIRQGDRVDSIYYLLDGQLELPELGRRSIQARWSARSACLPRMRSATATIVCRTDCRIYELSENQAKQLCLQDRKFGFAMMRLVIDRLLENNRRLLEPASREPELSAVR